MLVLSLIDDVVREMAVIWQKEALPGIPPSLCPGGKDSVSHISSWHKHTHTQRESNHMRLTHWIV